MSDLPNRDHILSDILYVKFSRGQNMPYNRGKGREFASDYYILVFETSLFRFVGSLASASLSAETRNPPPPMRRRAFPHLNYISGDGFSGDGLWCMARDER